MYIRSYRQQAVDAATSILKQFPSTNDTPSLNMYIYIYICIYTYIYIWINGYLRYKDMFLYKCVRIYHAATSILKQFPSTNDTPSLNMYIFMKLWDLSICLHIIVYICYIYTYSYESGSYSCIYTYIHTGGCCHIYIKTISFHKWHAFPWYV
jgi:hypothetical protein